MRHRGGRDHGNLHLLEGLLFVALLLIPLVLLQQQALPVQDRARQGGEVSTALEDVLAFYQETADPDSVYPSHLDRMVATALQGNVSLFEARVPRPLPKGVEFNVFLDQGQGLHRLRWDGTPPGEAVSASRLWSPGWATVLAAPQVALVDAERSALRLLLVPLRGAAGLADQPGLEVEATVLLPDGTTSVLRSFAPLRNGTAAGPSVSLRLLDDAGAAAYTVRPAAGNHSLVLEARETQGRAVPAGTPLQVLLPPGFRDVALRADRNPDWTGLQVQGTAYDGWNLTATLASPLDGDAVQLVINATRPAWNRFHLVEARLDEGRLGTLQGLYVDEGNATRSAALPPGRGPFVSLPANAPWSAAAPAGVVVAYPDDLARSLTLTALSLTPVGGAALLAAAGQEPASGWSFAGGVLSWAGNAALANDAAQEFRFTFQADAPASADTASEAGVEVALAAGHAPASRAQVHPGIFAWRAPAANASANGFDPDAGVHAVDLAATHRDEALVGEATFETVANDVVKASASDLARGLDEGSFEVQTPRAALGGAATVAWDLDRLVQELVGAPADSFKCYTSTAGAWAWTADHAGCLGTGGLGWQFVDEPPAVSLRVHHPAPAASGEVGALERTLVGLPVEGTATLPFNSTSLLGTHLVELRADFRLTGPSSATAVQTVRLLGLVDVHRPGSVPGERPLYDLVLQAWLPDWG